MEMRSEDWVKNWSRQAQERRRGGVGDWISVISGGTLAALGISRRSLPGAAVGAAGGYLVFRGVRGLTGGERHPEEVRVARSFTINKPREEVYRFWRNFENLPRFMSHLKAVHPGEGRRSHWIARGPLGGNVEWDAEILQERENELLAWRSLPGSDVEHWGSVEFKPAPGNRGTVVKVVLEYYPPVGAAGRALALFLGRDPEQQIREDLRHFKQISETGETPTIEGQPSGRRGMKGAVMQLMLHEREAMRKVG
jgi:uncharacterized membrane protein